MRFTVCSISEVISALVNCSFRTGSFPDELKIAKVCPIFKGGASNIFSNYRPISILQCFSKNFEKNAFTRLEKYINVNNILLNNQYGFRSKHSSYMALLDMYNRVTDSIDNHEVSVGIFIDLSKAFDTLDHSLLLQKLYHYSIRGIALQWFREYLLKRKQSVEYNDCTSSLANITCGVPQG